LLQVVDDVLLIAFEQLLLAGWAKIFNENKKANGNTRIRIHI
jgi:hypothetical protein